MDRDKFEFRQLRDMEFPSLTKSSRELDKWSMKNGIRLQAYSFDRPYKTYLMESFVQDFFSSPEMMKTFQVLDRNNRFGPIGIPADYVRMRSLKCSLGTMNIFSRLTESERVVRETGHIKTCPDDFVSPWLEEADSFGDPIQIGNELRKMLLVPESEFSNLFSKDEKDELLVRIFGHLVIGGSLCQHEDILSPYLTVTKLLYKDLVSVKVENSSEGDAVKVLSEVIQILSTRPEDSKESNQDLLFTKPHMNNFLYLVVDPFQRTVKTFYHHV